MSLSDRQPRYAAHGIPNVPVREKRPAVRGYLKIGLVVSCKLAGKFPLASAFGLACRPNGLTVLDVDTPDEHVLADAMSEAGPSPFVVRSGSGSFQAWYRNSGERRKVRPDPDKPIDILGDGFVVDPPSVGSRGAYAIISGSLDDLANLPAMRRPTNPKNVSCAPNGVRIDEGRRNETLWRFCMTQANDCRSVTELMEIAVNYNEAKVYERCLTTKSCVLSRARGPRNYRVIIGSDAVAASSLLHLFIMLASICCGTTTLITRRKMH